MQICLKYFQPVEFEVLLKTTTGLIVEFRKNIRVFQKQLRTTRLQAQVGDSRTSNIKKVNLLTLTAIPKARNQHVKHSMFTEMM